MSVKVSHLTHIYSKNGPYEQAAVKDVSFEIPDGAFVGIIGRTGSGKSTLIQHLNGLLKADSGSIIIDDTDITAANADLKKIRSKVGIVFQYPEYQLFEETVYKDVAYGPRNLGFDEYKIEQSVHESIKFVGLDDSVLSCSPFELSGGQKRRVAIAGVLAMKPSVIILDEPTAGLDPAGRNDLLERLKQLHDTQKSTIILVSHSMEDIASTVSHVMVMADGSLVAYDTVANIFSNSDLLVKYGLNVPQISQVINILNENGIKIPTDIYTVEAAADEIYNYIKGAKNA